MSGTDVKVKKCYRFGGKVHLCMDVEDEERVRNSCVLYLAESELPQDKTDSEGLDRPSAQCKGVSGCWHERDKSMVAPVQEVDARDANYKKQAQGKRRVEDSMPCFVRTQLLQPHWVSGTSAGPALECWSHIRPAEKCPASAHD